MVVKEVAEMVAQEILDDEGLKFEENEELYWQLVEHLIFTDSTTETKELCGLTKAK